MAECKKMLKTSALANGPNPQVRGLVVFLDIVICSSDRALELCYFKTGHQEIGITEGEKRENAAYLPLDPMENPSPSHGVTENLQDLREGLPND